MEFCHLVDLPHLPTDARYASNENRVSNRGDLIAVLAALMKTKTNQEWNGIFEGAKFPYGAVNTFNDVFKDPQVRSIDR